MCVCFTLIGVIIVSHRAETICSVRLPDAANGCCCRGSIIGQASNLEEIKRHMALGVVMFPGVINTVFMSGMMVRGSVFFVRIDEPGLFDRKKRRVGGQESVR